MAAKLESQDSEHTVPFTKAECEQEKEGEIRVVLLGKTGSGKSSLGNTLLGRDVFKVARGMCSGTDKCEHADMRRLGVNLQVTDTPGVCDTHRSEAEVLKEVGKSLAVSAPGPHVVLMVLRCDRRFTQEEYDAYVTLKRLFGDDICNHMIVVFAGIDCFGGSGEERDEGLQREVETAPGLLKQLMHDADGRYCGVDNTASRDHREQLAQMLLARIESLVERNEGRYYSSQLMQEVDVHMQSAVMQRMQEDKVTYEEAWKSTRLDIVEEKTAPSFFRKLLDIVGNKVLPVLKTLVNSAMVLGKDAVALYCSVM